MNAAVSFYTIYFFYLTDVSPACLSVDRQAVGRDLHRISAEICVFL